MKRGDLVGWLVVLVMVASLALYLTSQPALDKTDKVFTAMSTVSTLEEATKSGAFAFRMQHDKRTFRVRSEDPAVLQALRASYDSGNSVTLRVHLRGAAFAGSTGDSEFWVESFEYQGRRYGPFDAKVAWSWRQLSRGDELLLHGLADLSDQRHAEAEREFTAALDAGLNRPRSAKAFAGRAEALERLSYPPGREINARDDELLVRATADYRKAAQLDPADPELLLAVAYTLRSLGAYREALVTYDEVEKRFPQQYFRIAISRGSAARQLGDYAQALRALDDLVAKHGPQDGMMYHYHRARTLLHLDRFVDAADEASAGIKNQPDYAWAYLARACARSRLDQPDAVREDLDQALALLERDERSTRSDSSAFSLSEVMQLRAAAEPGAPCRVFGREPGERRRDRSPLLG